MSEIKTLHMAAPKAVEPAVAAPVPPSRPVQSRTASDIEAETRRAAAHCFEAISA